ncbi:MAG: DUF4349 domain-containing protein [Candidatus Woesearchaeota archaeon]
MTFKEQWTKIKENWLMLLVILIILGVFLVAVTPSTSTSGSYQGVGMNKALSSYAVEDASRMMPSPSGSFAPEVTERKLLKSANLNSEIEQGEFQLAEQKLKSIITSSGAYLLNENVQQNNPEHPYYTGYYTLKVDTKKYAAVISQLKEMGKVTSFSENTEDVTGSYTDLKVELKAEQDRLERYQKMFAEATEVSDKITLNDRIFDQERTIKYLQERINNVDTEVEYSSVYVSLQEKQSNYANVAIIGLSTLITSLVDSFNGLIALIVVLLPYLVVIVVVWLVVKKIRKNKKK